MNNNIKIVCDCGNDSEFNTIDEDTGKQTRVTEGEGQSATIKEFDIWQQHDVVGIVCQKCGKAIWLFI